MPRDSSPSGIGVESCFRMSYSKFWVKFCHCLLHKLTNGLKRRTGFVKSFKVESYQKNVEIAAVGCYGTRPKWDKRVGIILKLQPQLN